MSFKIHICIDIVQSKLTTICSVEGKKWYFSFLIRGQLWMIILKFILFCNLKLNFKKINKMTFHDMPQNK